MYEYIKNMINFVKKYPTVIPYSLSLAYLYAYFSDDSGNSQHNDFYLAGAFRMAVVGTVFAPYQIGAHPEPGEEEKVEPARVVNVRLVRVVGVREEEKLVQDAASPRLFAPSKNEEKPPLTDEKNNSSIVKTPNYTQESQTPNYRGDYPREKRQKKTKPLTSKERTLQQVNADREAANGGSKKSKRR
jgi:hypothetical protein